MCAGGCVMCVGARDVCGVYIVCVGVRDVCGGA
jgi:hypothetical protein